MAYADTKVTDETTASLRQLCAMTGTDNQDAKECLAEAGVEFVVNGGHNYPLKRAVRALCDRKTGLTSVEALNEERAKHERVKRLIAERNFRPVEEMEAAITTIGAAVNAELELMPAESQEKVAQAIKRAMEAFKEG